MLPAGAGDPTQLHDFFFNISKAMLEAGTTPLPV